MAKLEAKQLYKSFKGHTALNGLDLCVEAGEVFCLLGQNGAGKTTTINIFLGFMEASSGEAMVNGIKVSAGKADTNRHLAYIPETVVLYEYLSGAENLDFFSRIGGFRYKKNELEQLLIQAGLPKDAISRKMKFYSKGMRQKVAIAIALAKQCDILLMDEPTSGLDPKATKEFTQQVKALAADGKTILMATHDIFNAVNTATRIGIMKEGKLVHTLEASSITANALEQLYLETV
jgi:ABC-2 type transport system ATP-binding protein